MRQLRFIIAKLLSYIPTPLPVGMTEFESWADDILALSGQFADRDSMVFAIASMIMHLGPQRSSVPKNFFVQSLRKGAANQIAAQVFQDIKTRQAEAQKAAQTAAAQPADTASSSTPSNEQATEV